ncbi:MAG: Uma2 family endonuclease [Gemmataceae bacterium]
MPVMIHGGPFQSPIAGLHRLTVKQYHKMIADGVFAQDERIELIEGYLVEKAVQDPLHASSIQAVDVAVRSIAPPGWCSRVQLPITLTRSEPEPDFVLACGTWRDYATTHPSPDEVGLVVEVANTSLEFDRTDKLRIYARAGLPTYWIVNLVDGQIEVFEQPSGADYTSHKTYRRGDAVPLTLDGTVVGTIPAANLLP